MIPKYVDQVIRTIEQQNTSLDEPATLRQIVNALPPGVGADAVCDAVDWLLDQKHIEQDGRAGAYWITESGGDYLIAHRKHFADAAFIEHSEGGFD